MRIATVFILTLIFNYSSAQNLLVSYPLNGGGEDVQLNYNAIRYKDCEFTSEGLRTKGIYKESYISTPLIKGIDFQNFTISVQFKADVLKKMPVFTLGRSCRLVNFQLQQDGTIKLVANNGNDVASTSGQYQVGKWNQATIQYNNKQLKAYLNGVLIGSQEVSFSDQCMTTYLYGNQDISTTNYGNANSFTGTWRNVKVYNGQWTPKKKNDEAKEKITISWVTPVDNEKTTTSHYRIQANIESKQPLVGIKVYNNNHLVKSTEINSVGIYKYKFSELITLHQGENKLVMHALTAGSDQREFVTITHKIPQTGFAKDINGALSTKEITTVEADGYMASIMTSAPDNGSYVAWQEQVSKMVHVSRYDKSGLLIKDTKVGVGRNAYAITATNNGFTLLLDEKGKEGLHKGVHWLFFVRYDMNGNKVVDKKIIGHPNFDQEHNMGSCPYWSTPRIVYNGKYYYAVFGVFKKWDDGVVHQGDYLAILDNQGNEIKPENSKHGWSVAVKGWKWGSSHSFDQRIALDENYVHIMAKGDSYPRGIGYKRVLHNLDKPSPNTPNIVIQKIEDNAGGRMYQYVHASLGDIVPTGDGASLTSYASKEGRSSFDLAINYIDVDGTFTQKWLTNTPSLDEHNVYLTEYGDNYLLAWTTQVKNSSQPAEVVAKNMAAIIDVDGNFVVKAFELNGKLPLRSQFWGDEWYPYKKAYGSAGGITHDFQKYPNGDIGWVYTDRATGKLFLNRISSK